MNIGFTYDLKDDYLAAGHSPEEAAEFDKPETIDGIEAAILKLGHTVERIGRLGSLLKRLAQGSRWDLVFNIAEGLQGPGREAQIPAVLEGFGIPAAFGDSLCLALCLHKGFCKDVCRANGIATARHVLVCDADADFDSINLPYPLFAKPVAEGTGKGVTSAGKVDTPAQLRPVCLDLLARFHQPVLVETFLPGREFTVGVVGTGARARVLGVMEVLLTADAEPEVYSFENKDKYETRVTYRLAPDDAESAGAARLALESYRLLGCRDAGRADIRSDASGRPHFMEINPLAGLNPVHSDLPILARMQGLDFDGLVEIILSSAMERVRLPERAQ